MLLRWTTKPVPGLEKTAGFSPAWRTTSQAQQDATAEPAMDLAERPDCYLLSADMPGLGESEISITVEHGELILSADGGDSGPDDGAKLLYGERRPRRYFRKVRLGRDIDTAAIEARYDAGVLTVTLPKQAEAKPKTIPVTVSN